MFGNIPRENHKYVYVRAASALVNDDDHLSSVCIPVDAIRGISFFQSTLVIIRYEQPYNYVATDNGDSDFLLLTIASGGQKEFMKAFLDEVSFGEDKLIILGDNVTSEYLTTVTNVLSITSNTTAN